MRFVSAFAPAGTEKEQAKLAKEKIKLDKEKEKKKVLEKQSFSHSSGLTRLRRAGKAAKDETAC